MSVKVGDNVRYLNAVGGGVVTRFQGKDVVLVLEEDGFETPVLIREVVVVPKTNAYNFPTEEKPVLQGTTQPEQQEEEQEPDPTEKLLQYSFNERDETADGEEISLYLAFVPNDIKQLQTTDLKLYLINDSNYYVQFQLLSGKEEMHLRKADVIEPQTKIYLETLNKLQLNDVQYLNFQGFAFKKRDFVQKPAIDAPIEISPVKFYKLHSFKENDYFDTDAMMVTLIEKDLPNMPIHVSAADIERALRQKEQPNATPHKSKESNKPTVIEVDLHINELLDSVAGLSNAEILRVQMDKFNEVMRSNQKKKGQKIVFIHGKGEGVLRKEIEKELRRSYKSCYYQDASFQQYGFGATQVTIR